MLALLLAATLAPTTKVAPVRWSPAPIVSDLSAPRLSLAPVMAPAASLKLAPAAPMASFDTPLAAAQATPSAPQAHYQEAVAKAESEGWSQNEKPVIAAAAEFLKDQGVQADEVTANTAAGIFDGLRLRASMDGDVLNRFAYRVEHKLGATLDYLPKRTGERGAAAAHNEHESRIMLPRLDSEEFMPAVMHEARHAWYSALKKKGDLRLFHLQAVVVRGNAPLVPGAQTYTDYVSFEELSTFPKTLKHLVSARQRGLAMTRYWQLLDIMRTTGALSEAILRYRMTPRKTADGMRVDIGPVAFLIPEGKDPKTELETRAKLTIKLVNESIPWLTKYREALGVEDWAAANAAADKLVKLAAEADKAFVAQYQAPMAVPAAPAAQPAKKSFWQRLFS